MPEQRTAEQYAADQHRATFKAEAIAGRRLANRAIIAGLAVIAGWLFIQIGWERVVETLRAYHARIERCIFEFGGTLDKFLGDGVMATFGTPDPGPRDAANALAAACAI